MACNLNFNQCNLGCQFPRPIFNCRCRLLSILNSSEISIVNPVPIQSNALSTIFPQFVPSQQVVQSNLAFVSGNAIQLVNGEFLLEEGRYLVSYAVSGAFGENGLFSVEIEQDGFVVSGSESNTSGVAGTSANLSNSSIVNITTVSSTVRLVNVNTVGQNITSGNITIQKL